MADLVTHNDMHFGISCFTHSAVTKLLYRQDDCAAFLSRDPSVEQREKRLNNARQKKREQISCSSASVGTKYEVKSTEFCRFKQRFIQLSNFSPGIFFSLPTGEGEDCNVSISDTPEEKRSCRGRDDIFHKSERKTTRFPWQCLDDDIQWKYIEMLYNSSINHNFFSLCTNMTISFEIFLYPSL